MTRVLPLLWTGFGFSLGMAYSDPRYWAFLALVSGIAAVWCEVLR